MARKSSGKARNGAPVGKSPRASAPGAVAKETGGTKTAIAKKASSARSSRSSADAGSLAKKQTTVVKSGKKPVVKAAPAKRPAPQKEKDAESKALRASGGKKQEGGKKSAATPAKAPKSSVSRPPTAAPASSKKAAAAPPKAPKTSAPQAANRAKGADGSKKTSSKGKQEKSGNSVGRKELMRRLLNLRSGYQRPVTKKAPKSAPPAAALLIEERAKPLPPMTDLAPIEPSPDYKTLKKYPYSKKEVERFRKVLGEEHDRIVRDIAILDEISNTHDEGGGYDHHIFSIHIAEHATDNSMLETNLMQRRLLQDRLAQILDSLRRLEEGSYGVCQSCGAPIGVERLLAKPHARLCIGCRRRIEQERRMIAP